MGETMKYNDYPLPDEKLIKILNNEYRLKHKSTSLSINEVELLEQKNKLDYLYQNISKEKIHLNRLFKNKEVINACLDNQLKILADMGVNTTISQNVPTRSMFVDYLRCESEILKALLFLMLLDNLRYDKVRLNQILLEQVDMFGCILDMQKR